MFLPIELIRHIVEYVKADQVCGRHWLPDRPNEPRSALRTLSQTSMVLRYLNVELWSCVTVKISCRKDENQELQRLIRALSQKAGLPRHALEKINVIIETPSEMPPPFGKKPRPSKAAQQQKVLNGNITGGRSWYSDPIRGPDDPSCAALFSLAAVLIQCPQLKHIRLTGWVIANQKRSLCDLLQQCPDLQSLTIDLGPQGDIAQIEAGWQVTRGADWQELLISPTNTVFQHQAASKSQPGYCGCCEQSELRGKLHVKRARMAVPWLIAFGAPTSLPLFFHPLIEKRWMLPVWAQVEELDWHWGSEFEDDGDIQGVLDRLSIARLSIDDIDRAQQSLPPAPEQYTAKDLRDHYHKSEEGDGLNALRRFYGEDEYDGLNDFDYEWGRWRGRSRAQHFLIRPAQAFRRLLQAHIRTNDGRTGEMLDLDDIAKQVFDLIHTAPELIKWRMCFPRWSRKCESTRKDEDEDGESTNKILRRVAQVLIRPQVDAMWESMARRGN